MAPPPAYKSTPSQGETSLNTNSPKHWSSTTTHLPSYSTVSPSNWWEEAALDLLRTSHDFDEIKLIIKFTPGLDPTSIATVLSSRRKGWLDAFLNVLRRDKALNEPPCDSLLSTATAIVDIIKERSFSPAVGWNWIFSALKSSMTDILTVAEKLDSQVHSEFCAFAHEEWVAWCSGYQTQAIADFLDTTFKFRNELVQYARQDPAVADRIVSLQKVLPSQQPVLYWIVSTAISFDTSSIPSEALRFLLDPIYELLYGQSSGILPFIQKLSILSTRFKLRVVNEADANWPEPFSTDFFFWESIQSNSPEDLAKSNTESIAKLHYKLSSIDLLEDSQNMKDIEILWSDLSNDILACLIANGKLAGYFMDFAESLLLLRNLHSAGAVGLALFKWGFQPRKPSPVWDIINPEDNFAGGRKFMAKELCLPLMFLYLRELRQAGNAPYKLIEAFQFVGFFGRKNEAEIKGNAVLEEKADREGTIVHRNPLYHIVLLPSSWSADPQKRKAMPELEREYPQQRGLGTKRIKANDNPARSDSYLTRQSALDNAKCTSNNDSEILKLYPQSCLSIRRKQDLFSKPFSTDDFLIAFQEHYADEIWALKAKTNFQILKEAYQMMIILQGTVDSPVSALEILSGFKHTQLILLSCAITDSGLSILSRDCLNSWAWENEQKEYFASKFTKFVRGTWRMNEVLDKWEELVKVLSDKIRLIKP